MSVLSLSGGVESERLAFKYEFSFNLILLSTNCVTTRAQLQALKSLFYFVLDHSFGIEAKYGLDYIQTLKEASGISHSDIS